MTVVATPGRGFIMSRRDEPGTQTTIRHATRLKNEAGGATPDHNTTLTSFLSPVRHKPIPSRSRANVIGIGPDVQLGRRSTWHDLKTMPHTTRTTVAAEKFFSLKAAAEECVEPSAKKEKRTENAAAVRNAVAVTSSNWVGGASTPHPLSHQSGVSGGGGIHHFTPDWCEAFVGVTALA